MVQTLQSILEMGKDCLLLTSGPDPFSSTGFVSQELSGSRISWKRAYAHSPNRLRAGSLLCFPISRKAFLTVIKVNFYSQDPLVFHVTALLLSQKLKCLQRNKRSGDY